MDLRKITKIHENHDFSIQNAEVMIAICFGVMVDKKQAGANCLTSTPRFRCLIRVTQGRHPLETERGGMVAESQNPEKA